jgi:hypothetical protein
LESIPGPHKRLKIRALRGLVVQSFVGELAINLNNFDLISTSVLNKTSMSPSFLEKVKTHEARQISQEEKKRFTFSLNICPHPCFPGDHVDISFKDDVTVTPLGFRGVEMSLSSLASYF